MPQMGAAGRATAGVDQHRGIEHRPSAIARRATRDGFPRDARADRPGRLQLRELIPALRAAFDPQSMSGYVSSAGR